MSEGYIISPGRAGFRFDLMPLVRETFNFIHLKSASCYAEHYAMLHLAERTDVTSCL